MTSWTRAEQRWRDTLLAALIPSGGSSGLPGLGDVDTESFWRIAEQTAPPLLRFALRLAVWVMTWLPLLVVGRARRFGGLSAAEQDRLLTRVASCRWYLLRQLVQTLRVMACSAYLRAPEVRLHFAPNDLVEAERDATEEPSS